jgi:hypothetical protein
MMRRFTEVANRVCVCAIALGACVATLLLPATATEPAFPQDWQYCVRRGYALCGTYSVLDVGKKAVPKLDASQKRWLALIKRTPAYANRWKYLRFHVNAGTEKGQFPVLVFDATGDEDEGLLGHYPIVGVPCGVVYNARERSTEPMPASACSGPTAPPVIGQRAFLRAWRSSPR